MNQEFPIELHIGENWLIPFVAQNFDGTPMPLPIGSRVEFRLDDPLGSGLSVSTDDAITITNRTTGLGTISITPAMQTAAGITPHRSYVYELRINNTTAISVQSEGQFIVLPSLFVN